MAVKLDCGEAFKVKPANACRVGRGSQSGQFGPTSSVVYSVLGALWRRAMSENQNAVAPRPRLARCLLIAFGCVCVVLNSTVVLAERASQQSAAVCGYVSN